MCLPPLQKLIECFRIKPRQFEMIMPDPWPPTYKRAFTTTIAETKEELIKDEGKDESEIRIYTDGSGFEGNAGVAAVFYRKGVKELVKILRYHLGSLKKHTTFKGEAVGSILVAWMLQGQPEVGKLEATSYTDSQAFIKVMGVRKTGPGQYLVLEYLRLTDIMNDGTNAPSTTKFTLKWVVAHEGVAGNERVNEEVKKAAQGDSSPPEELPLILQKHLPTSATVVKQEFTEKQKIKWLETWKTSLRYARFQHIDKDFPFNKFQKISKALLRSQTSLLTQL